MRKQTKKNKKKKNANEEGNKKFQNATSDAVAMKMILGNQQLCCQHSWINKLPWNCHWKWLWEGVKWMGKWCKTCLVNEKTVEREIDHWTFVESFQRLNKNYAKLLRNEDTLITPGWIYNFEMNIEEASGSF
jgi:hypothetical protein